MDVDALVAASGLLASPFTFAFLAGLATVLIWRAFTPTGPVEPVRQRLDGYVTRADLDEPERTPMLLSVGALLPLLRRVLRVLGQRVPNQVMDAQATRRMLIRAGEPWRLTALDFYGLRLLASSLMGASIFVLTALLLPVSKALFCALVAAGFGLFVPVVWLSGRADRRKADIARSLANALDMLTIGVEAGLAFESALLRVAEQWDNALTREFRRAVVEMRVGVARDVALQRLVERTDVADLRTFVAVIIQSANLGVSIAQVLHNQAAVMREKRRQRAEELARQASVKMAFPLVFFVFPSMFVVILGPALPGIMSMFK